MRKESCRLDQNEQIWMDVKDGESCRYRMKLCCNTLKSRSLSVLRSFEKGFPGSSADKESTCNAGDPSLIPELGRSPGEGIGYPFQFSWASLVVQMVKKICLQCERPVFDPWIGKILWKRAFQPTPLFLPGESPWTEEPGGLQSIGSQRVRHD